MAVVGVLMSAVSLYYYMGIVVYMYLRDREDDTPAPLPSRLLAGAIGLCAVVTVLLGLLPGPIVELAKASLLPLP